MQVIQVNRSAILLIFFLSVLSSQMAHIVSVSHFPSKKLSKSSPNSIDATIHKKPKKTELPRCLDKPNGSILCNSTSYYPIQKIKKKMGNKRIVKEFKRIFGVAAKPYEGQQEMKLRFNFEEMNLCPTRTYKYYPKTAINTRGKLRFVVQTRNNYTQEVSIVKCLNEGKSCGKELHSIIGLRTFCKQERITVRLLSLDDNGNFVLDYFPIEGGCACFLAKNVNAIN